MRFLGNVAEFLGSLGLNTRGAVSYRNRLINGAFIINQRLASSVSTAYAAGAYILDRWKAGAGGCTLSFAAAANGDVTVTITAGTLIQIMEGSTYLPEGGAYILSWSGTAQARIYQGTATGTYGASPRRVAGLTAGTNTTVEFSTGTVTLAQFEPGTVVTVFERRDDELQRCRRYYLMGCYGLALQGAAGKEVAYYINFPVPLRSTSPTVTFFTDYRYNSTSTNETPTNVSDMGFRFRTVADNTDILNVIGRFFATAEI